MLGWLREKINGYKTYITAVVGLLTVIMAWAAGEQELAEAVAAITVILEGLFLRAGVKKAQTGAIVAVNQAYVDGVIVGTLNDDDVTETPNSEE